VVCNTIKSDQASRRGNIKYVTPGDVNVTCSETKVMCMSHGFAPYLQENIRTCSMYVKFCIRPCDSAVIILVDGAESASTAGGIYEFA